MAYSWETKLASDGQTIFSFGIPYLSRNHIHIFRTDSGTGQPFEFFSFHFTSTYTLQIDGGAFEGEVIRIQRITPIEAPLVDFVNGSNVNESTLDLQYLHNLYVLQERLDQETITLRQNTDGVWDFQGKSATGLLSVETFENIQTQHNGGNLPLRPRLNFVDSDIILFDVANNPVNERIDISATVLTPTPLEDLTATTITDSDVETTLASITIPAGRMGVNSRLTIESLVTFRNDSGANRYLELSLYIDGTRVGTTQYEFIDSNTNLHHLLLCGRFQNLGALTAQMVFAKVERMGLGSPTGSFELAGLLSVNTASAFVVEVKGQLVDASTLQVVTHRGTKITVQ